MAHTLRFLVAVAAVTATTGAGCSSCASPDTSLLEPLPDAGDAVPDAGTPVDAPPAVDAPVARRDAGREMGLGDPSDCGGATCDRLEACLDGTCVCRAGRTRIEGRCVDLQSDPDNCGEPGKRCRGGTVCSNGSCHEACRFGTEECDRACVRLLADPANCGECGHRCDRGEYCRRGECIGYVGGGSCTACPCDACTGDFDTCCVVADERTLVACVEADSCL